MFFLSYAQVITFKITSIFWHHKLAEVKITRVGKIKLKTAQILQNIRSKEIEWTLFITDTTGQQPREVSVEPLLTDTLYLFIADTSIRWILSCGPLGFVHKCVKYEIIIIIDTASVSFFFSCQMWCSDFSPTQIFRRAKADPHALPIYRWVSPRLLLTRVHGMQCQGQSRLPLFYCETLNTFIKWCIFWSVRRIDVSLTL